MFERIVITLPSWVCSGRARVSAGRQKTMSLHDAPDGDRPIHLPASGQTRLWCAGAAFRALSVRCSSAVMRRQP
jgi:hypothetical protein